MVQKGSYRADLSRGRDLCNGLPGTCHNYQRNFISLEKHQHAAPPGGKWITYMLLTIVTFLFYYILMYKTTETSKLSFKNRIANLKSKWRPYTLLLPFACG